MALGHRLDPGNAEVDANGDDTDDPDDTIVMCTVEAEDECEDDATKVAQGANYTRNNTIGEWVDVGHDSKVSTVGCIHEDGETSDKSEHGGLIVGVEETDGEHESTHGSTAEADPHLLGPDRVGVVVDDVGNDTSHGAEDDVEETEHGGPATGTSLTELGEVLEVVGADDGVDGELTTEGAGVLSGQGEGLRRENDKQGFLEGWGNDNF